MPGVISGARLGRTRFGSVSRCGPELCAARRRAERVISGRAYLFAAFVSFGHDVTDRGRMRVGRGVCAARGRDCLWWADSLPAKSLMAFGSQNGWQKSDRG